MWVPKPLPMRLRVIVYSSLFCNPTLHDLNMSDLKLRRLNFIVNEFFFSRSIHFRRFQMVLSFTADAYRNSKCKSFWKKVIMTSGSNVHAVFEPQVNKHKPFPSNQNFLINTANSIARFETSRRVDFPCNKLLENGKKHTRNVWIPLRSLATHSIHYNNVVDVLCRAFIRRIFSDGGACMCSWFEYEHKQRQYRQIHTQLNTHFKSHHHLSAVYSTTLQSVAYRIVTF